VLWVHVDLLQVGGRGLEQLDVCEPHGNAVRERDPKAALSSSGFQVFEPGGFGQHGRRRVAGE
jgi:hypothetical protein